MAIITARVRWKNNLPVAVSNATVEVVFDGSSIDPHSISSARGDFDTGRNALRWVPGRIPELSVLDPGESGEFEFGLLRQKANGRNEERKRSKCQTTLD